jgi:hypothetical protein
MKKCPFCVGAILKGKRIADAMGSVCKAAVAGAQPLSNNSYKVIVAKGIAERVLSSFA